MIYEAVYAGEDAGSFLRVTFEDLTASFSVSTAKTNLRHVSRGGETAR